MEKLRHLKAEVGTRSFLLLDGVVHDLPEWVTLGGHGTVSGVSNMAPATTVRLMNLCEKESRSSAEDEEIDTLRDMLARFDAVAMPLGVRGLSQYPCSITLLEILTRHQSLRYQICASIARLLGGHYHC